MKRYFPVALAVTLGLAISMIQAMTTDAATTQSHTSSNMEMPGTAGKTTKEFSSSSRSGHSGSSRDTSSASTRGLDRSGSSHTQDNWRPSDGGTGYSSKGDSSFNSGAPSNNDMGGHTVEDYQGDKSGVKITPQSPEGPGGRQGTDQGYNVGQGDKTGNTSFNSGAPRNNDMGGYTVEDYQGDKSGVKIAPKTSEGPGGRQGKDQGYDVSQGEKGGDQSFNSGAPIGDTGGTTGGIEVKDGAQPSPVGDTIEGSGPDTRGTIGTGGTVITDQHGGGAPVGDPEGTPGDVADIPYADSLPDVDTSTLPGGTDQTGPGIGNETGPGNRNTASGADSADTPQNDYSNDTSDTSSNQQDYQDEQEDTSGGDDDPDVDERPNPEDPYGGGPDWKSHKAKAGGDVDVKSRKTVKEYTPADGAARNIRAGGVRSTNPYVVKEYTPADVTHGGLNPRAGGRVNALDAKAYQPDDTQRGARNLGGSTNVRDAARDAHMFRPIDTPAARNLNTNGLNTPGGAPHVNSQELHLSPGANLNNGPALRNTAPVTTGH